MRRKLDVGALYSCLESQREGDGLSWKQLADLLELDFSVFVALSEGKAPDVDSFLTMASYLSIGVERLSIPSSTMKAVSRYQRQNSSLPALSNAEIEALLLSISSPSRPTIETSL